MIGFLKHLQFSDRVPRLEFLVRGADGAGRDDEYDTYADNDVEVQKLMMKMTEPSGVSLSLSTSST